MAETFSFEEAMQPPKPAETFSFEEALQAPKSEPIRDAFRNAGASVNRALESVTNLAGADNAASQFFRDNAETLEGNLSEAAKLENEAASAELAATQGFLPKVGVAARQAVESPLQTTGKAVGFVLPTLATGGAGAYAGLGARGLALLNAVTGAAQGAGAVKGGIYETVLQTPDTDLMADPEYAKLRETLPEAQAKEVFAAHQQSYAENPGRIATGAAVGAAVGATGAEGAIAKGLARDQAKQVLTRSAALSTIPRVAATEAATEMPQEMLETALANTGAASGGAMIDPLQGVAEAGGQALVMGPVAGAGGGGLQVAGSRAQLRQLIRDEAAALDASTVLDAEAPAPAPAAPPALPAPRVVVSSDGQARMDGSGRVFDEPAAKVVGRAEEPITAETVRETIRSEIKALLPQPEIVPDARGEPAPLPRASATPISVNPAGDAAVAGDTRDAFTAAEESLDARARKLFPKDEQAREDWKVAERARELGYEARVRELAEASNARKKKRGVDIHTTEGAQPRQAPARDTEPTSELGVVSRKLPDGSTEYFFATQPEVRFVVKPSDKFDARVIVEAPQQGQPQLVRAALADGPIAAGPKSLDRGIAQQIGATTDRFGVTRLIGRASDRAKMQAETNRMAARSAVALAQKRWAADSPQMDAVRQAVAADPKRAVTALRQKDEEAALAALREIAPQQAPAAAPPVPQPDDDTFTPMAEIEKDQRAVYREQGIPDDPEFVNYVTEAARDAVKAGHMTREEFFTATRAARENKRDEAMAALRASDQRRGAVNASGTAKAADPEAVVSLDLAGDFDSKFGEPKEMGATGRNQNYVSPLSTDQAAVVGAALRDLVEMGLPRAWIDSVQRFFVVSDQLRNSAATFWNKSQAGQPVRIISFTEGAVDTIPGRNARLQDHQQFRGRLAHELAHNADWTGSAFASMSHPDLQISVENGRVNPTGKVAVEMFDAFLERRGALGRLVTYPFLHLASGDLDPRLGAAELHAQIIRAYFTNRGELKSLAPEAFRYAEQFIRQGTGSGARVQGEVRQVADGGLRRDVRGGLDVADAAGAGQRQDSRPAAGADGLLDERGERQGELNGREAQRSDRDGEGRRASRSIAPLEGAPTVAGATGPDPRLVEVAEQYARDNGIQLRRQRRYAQVDEERAKRIAQAYDGMAHAPRDPKVSDAYQDLIRQTVAQYRALEKAGYRFWFFDESNDPYQGNPWNAMRDLRANQRMGVFATEAGFGSGVTDLNTDDNPLLADTGIRWPWGSLDGQPKRVLANDLFRAVHDAFGHGLEGAGFRAQGEENAWQSHARLFTGAAVGAMTSETRGQNSWLNYGPYGEQNRNAKVEDTVFADQKTGLMPEWTWTEGIVDDEGQADGLDADRQASPAAAQKAVSLEQYLYTDKLVMTPKFRNQAELGAWLDEKAQAALGRSLVGDYSDEALQHVAGVFAREGELAMAKAGNAGEWYRNSIENALANAAKLYPEIGSDPNHKFMFTLALAVTSNGTDMATNTRLGFTAYEHWRVLGKLPLSLKGAGERGKNMTDAFDAVNRMIEKAGKVDTVREFMLTKRTVREIRDGLASIGVKVSQAENADSVVYGGYALGPKIGAAFLPNLNGKWDALTADRWFSRTFNRIVGGMLDSSGKTVDSPRSGAERQFMRDALNAAIKKLKRKGYPLEMADLQALLWYPEKELYAVMGVSDKRAAPTDYEQETRKYVEARLQTREPEAAAAGTQPGGRQRDAQGGAARQGKQVALFDAAGDPDASFGLDERPGRIGEELKRVEGSKAARMGAAATKVVAPVTATAQVVNKATDRIGEQLARVTGVKKLGEKVVDLVDKVIDTQSSWTWVERLKQGLISDYGLPEEYLSAKIDKQSRENKLLREAKHTLDRLSSMTPDQLAVAYQWLQEKPDTARERELIARLPAEQMEVVLKMKDDIDALSQEAVKLGLITQETYERNRMAYVHRSYKKYEAELKGGQVAARQRALRLKGDQFKGRGMELEANLDRVHGDLPEELKGLKLEMLERRDQDGRLRRREFLVQGAKRPESLSGYKSAGVWEVRDATKDGHLKVWRDFTLEERQRMGEIEDARYGFARTMLQGVRDVETARFLAWTAREYAKKDADGLDVVDIKPLAQLLGNQTFTRDEWVKVPEAHIAGTNIPRYGKLAGMYLPGVMWNDLAGVMELRDSVWDKMLSAWKISKTALSPAVHVNNVMANFIMADLADVGVNDIRRSLETIMAAKGGDAKAKALIERYEDSGAESGSFAANEIKTTTLEPLLKQIAKDEPEAVQKASLAQVVSLAAHGQVGEAAAAAMKTLPARAIAGTVETMIRAYQAEDSVFRLAKFLNEIEAGKTDLAAGRAAREAFLNYDINAPWVRAARRTALPFISFTYRAVPLLARAMAKKPWKFAKYAALGHGLSMLAYGMLGEAGDEEEERRLMPDEFQGTFFGIPKMIRLPWNDKDGDPMWLDIRRWLPAGDIAEVAGSKSAVPLPQWLSIGGPLSLLIDFYSNTNWRGDKVVQGTDSPGETIEKTSDMVLKFALPNLPMPGLGWALRQVGAPVDTGMLDPYSWANLERAIKGAKTPSGKERSVGVAAANAFGVKVQSRRIAEELGTIDRRYKQAEREIKTDISRIASQAARGEITPAERERRIAREVEKLKELGRRTAEKVTPE